MEVLGLRDPFRFLRCPDLLIDRHTDFTSTTRSMSTLFRLVLPSTMAGLARAASRLARHDHRPCHAMPRQSDDPMSCRVTLGV